MAPGMGRSTPLLDLLARVPGMKPTLRGAAALVRPLGKRKRFPVRPAPAPGLPEPHSGSGRGRSASQPNATVVTEMQGGGSAVAQGKSSFRYGSS